MLKQEAQTPNAFLRGAGSPLRPTRIRVSFWDSAAGAVAKHEAEWMRRQRHDAALTRARVHAQQSLRDWRESAANAFLDDGGTPPPPPLRVVVDDAPAASRVVAVPYSPCHFEKRYAPHRLALPPLRMSEQAIARLSHPHSGSVQAACGTVLHSAKLGGRAAENAMARTSCLREHQHHARLAAMREAARNMTSAAAAV